MSGTDYKLFINGNDLTDELETTIIETCSATRIKCTCLYNDEDYNEIHNFLKSKKRVKVVIMNTKNNTKIIEEAGVIIHTERLFPIDTELFKFIITL